MSLGGIVPTHRLLQNKDCESEKCRRQKDPPSCCQQLASEGGCAFPSTPLTCSICWTHQVLGTSSLCEAHSQQTDVWAFKRQFRL